MNRVIIVHGLKRSGNHAIINWIAAHEPLLFVNNAIPIAPILNGEHPMPTPESFDRWFGSAAAEQIPSVKDATNSSAAAQSPLIVGLEDHELDVNPFIGAPCRVENVLIVRDPVNLFASRIRKAALLEQHPAYRKVYPKREGPDWDRVLNLWKSHAREFLGETSSLINKVVVYFDAWVSNRSYRERLSTELDLAFTDAGFSKISSEGGGSSFDGVRFDGENLSMKVLDRRSSLSDSEKELLDNLLKDNELQTLSLAVNESDALHK